MNDASPDLQEIIEDRLEELLFGGHITQGQYQEAILGNPLPLQALTGFLETCFGLPCERV